MTNRNAITKTETQRIRDAVFLAYLRGEDMVAAAAQEGLTVTQAECEKLVRLGWGCASAAVFGFVPDFLKE